MHALGKSSWVAFSRNKCVRVSSPCIAAGCDTRDLGSISVPCFVTLRSWDLRVVRAWHANANLSSRVSEQ
eukprot:6206706-Pleurochrysis_carterae.AAC.3